MVELRPRRTRATAAAESAAVEETPKPKTPKASKRKAVEDVSPSATKKQKAVKTPAKSKDTEEPATEKVEEPTPKAKKGKTPVKAKAKAAEEETPVSKTKKAKTPAKAKVAEEEALQEPAEKTPASKSKKEKTPSKLVAAESTPSKEPEQPTPKTKKEKTPAKASHTPKATPKVTPKATPKATPKEPAKETPVTKQVAKKPKSAKKAKAEPEPVSEAEIKEAEEAEEETAALEDSEDASVEEETDEKIQALIQTIDAGDDDEPESGVVLFEEGQDVGKIPELSNKEKKRAKKALAAAKEKEDTGVIYIGRLPHGFYEHEMKSYFSQFGPIRNLRLSRNKKTGKPKHYAFVEFEEASTAEIVAKTMDNYLLFGHILKCSVIPKAQVHDDLFKGANRRFKAVPWNKMEGKVMERPMLESKWDRKIKKEQKRRADRAKQLEAIGYEFTAPEVKKKADAAKAITAPETAEEEITKVIEEAKTEAVEAVEAAPAAAEKEATPETPVEEKEQESTPKPAKRGRGRPAKTPQKAAMVAETPRSTRRRKA